jgi:uncharacterized protein (TIGR00297 family)
MLERLILGSVLSLAVSFVSYRLSYLTFSGFVSAALIGAAVFGLGGIVAAVPLLVFFLTSTLISILPQKREPPESSEGYSRDGWQVLSNGGVGGLFIVANHVVPHGEGFFIGYVASLAAANADTWGTEIGTRLSSKPLLLVTLRSVDAGTSGAVSWVGIIGSVVGSVVVGLSVWTWYPSLAALWVISLAGVLGTVIDTVLGGTIQARFTCVSCRRKVEVDSHCGTPAFHSRGIAWVDNNWVNVACTLGGAFLGALLWKIVA